MPSALRLVANTGYDRVTNEAAVISRAGMEKKRPAALIEAGDSITYTIAASRLAVAQGSNNNVASTINILNFALSRLGVIKEKLESMLTYLQTALDPSLTAEEVNAMGLPFLALATDVTTTLAGVSFRVLGANATNVWNTAYVITTPVNGVDVTTTLLQLVTAAGVGSNLSMAAAQLTFAQAAATTAQASANTTIIRGYLNTIAQQEEIVRGHINNFNSYSGVLQDQMAANAATIETLSSFDADDAALAMADLMSKVNAADAAVMLEARLRESHENLAQRILH